MKLGAAAGADGKELRRQMAYNSLQDTNTSLKILKSISDPDFFYKNHTIVFILAHIGAPLSLRKSCSRDSQALCHMSSTD